MFDSFKITLATVLVVGSASLALADDYTDQTADAMRSYGPAAQSRLLAARPVAQARQLTTRSVALRPSHAVPRAPTAAAEMWMDRASQNVDGGGD